MQLVAEQNPVHSPKGIRKISPRYSSGLFNEPGETGVVKTMPVKFNKRQQPEKPADFSSWIMPEQEMGVIKCREHDFL
jgi:hypothetical protein